MQKVKVFKRHEDALRFLTSAGLIENSKHIAHCAGRTEIKVKDNNFIFGWREDLAQANNAYLAWVVVQVVSPQQHIIELITRFEMVDDYEYYVDTHVKLTDAVYAEFLQAVADAAQEE
jgi:phosphotransferase system IIB component